MVMESMRQIQARMGWIDTRVERVAWRALRRAPKAMRALTLLLVVGVAQVGETQIPVTDAMSLSNRIYQFSAQGIRDNLANLWKETRENQRWVTDVVQTYRTIKMAKSAYQSLATFDLSQNISLLDILPEIDLPEGRYLGSGLGPTSTKDKDTYVALRFKTSPGGMASTFTNWAKFKPKLKIDVNQLAGELANLDFDAVKMVQYKNLKGDPFGKAIEEGRVQDAVGMRLNFWDKTIEAYNDFEGQERRHEAALGDLNEQIAKEQRNFQEESLRLRERVDLEGDALRRKLHGVYVPSTYDLIWSPKIALAQEILKAQQKLNKAELDAKFDALRKLKKTDEVRQNAIKGEVAIKQIQAEMGNLIQKRDKTFNDLLEKDKATFAEFEKGQSIGPIQLNSDDLKNMKLSKSAQEEFDRFCQSQATAFQVLQLKLQSLRDGSEAQGKIEAVTQDLHDLTVQLSNAYKIKIDDEMIRVSVELEKIDQNYKQQWNDREDQRRQEDYAASQAIWSGFSEANRLYFKELLEKKPLSAASVFENLTKSYFSFIKTYFGGRSIGEVMGPKYVKYADDMQKELDFYNKLPEQNG